MSIRFGKKDARIDERTIRLKTILKEMPAYPPSYFIDNNLSQPIPISMLGNDTHGDCVICAKANHTLRFEEFEQDTIIPITTEDCLSQYWKEQGWRECSLKFLNPFNPKPDRGLVMLDSLNDWRHNGWDIAGKKYTIYAYASVPTAVEVKAAVYLLNGVNMGIRVPQSAIDQFKAGQPWEALSPLDSRFVGGHAIYVVGYDSQYLYVITWGKVQKMSWAFYSSYTDEGYAIVDQADPWLGVNSPVDILKLNEILHQITSG